MLRIGSRRVPSSRLFGRCRRHRRRRRPPRANFSVASRDRPVFAPAYGLTLSWTPNLTIMDMFANNRVPPDLYALSAPARKRRMEKMLRSSLPSPRLPRPERYRSTFLATDKFASETRTCDRKTFYSYKDLTRNQGRPHFAVDLKQKHT